MSVVMKKKKKKIMLLVLYGYETWSVTLREEHRLKIPENSVLRRMSVLPFMSCSV